MNRLLAIGLIFIFGCGPDNAGGEEIAPEIVAEAQIFEVELVGDDEYEVKENAIGTASFYQTGEVVTVEISLQGMVPGSSKAVHIHNGTPEDPGRHWNQGSFVVACNARSLGEVWAKPFYGDVGNVPVDANGAGFLTLRTDLWRINSGDERDLLGKTIIVHDQPEDFLEECDPAHDHTHAHSNPKIGGGSISLMSDIPLSATFKMEQKEYPAFTICN